MNYYQNMYGQYPQQQLNLNGKLVDSIDVVKMMDIPIGSYGIFPKTDLSEIYVKTWNNNGTTNIAVFKPVVVEEPPTYESLLTRIEALEEALKPHVKEF